MFLKNENIPFLSNFNDLINFSNIKSIFQKFQIIEINDIEFIDLFINNREDYIFTYDDFFIKYPNFDLELFKKAYPDFKFLSLKNATLNVIQIN